MADHVDERPDDAESRPPGDVSRRSETVIDNPVDSSPEDDLVAQLLEHSLDVSILASAVEAQQPADAADTLETLDESEAADILEEMELDNAADALSNMVAPLAVSVLEDLAEEDAGYAARLLAEMPADDAADLLQFVPDAVTDAILAEMPVRDRAILEKLIAFDPETAGGLMNPAVLEVGESLTVREAVVVIRDSDPDAETQNVYVIDDSNRLAGILDLRRLVISQPDERIGDICERHVEAIPPELDREEVALEFEKYSYSALPVVDRDRNLLGVITVDDVLESIRAEGTEDAQKMVGAGGEEMVFSSIPDKLRSRIPWLVVNLVTSFVAAVVVLNFENLIAEIAVLAVLMPVIANQSGNAGQQSLAVTLRGIVLGQVRTKVATALLIRESMVGAINGLLAGTLVAIVLGLLAMVNGTDIWKIGIVIAISMTFSLTIGTFTGTALPLLMRRFGADPATASTIFLTMVTDSLSFFIFLGMASLLSGWIGIS
ncbi:MAG: magnesium transporter [Planctomycetaceae bacterium]|nr:magnesium transporter [Planctomycetaceae bacterium]